MYFLLSTCKCKSVDIVYLYGRPLGVFYRSLWAASPVFYSCSPPLDSAGNHKKIMKLMKLRSIFADPWIQLEIIKKNKTHETKKFFRRSLWAISILALHLWIQLEIMKIMKLMKVHNNSSVLRNSSTLVLHLWIELEIIKSNETHGSKNYSAEISLVSLLHCSPLKKSP
jgi:hypothetical protein